MSEQIEEIPFHEASFSDSPGNVELYDGEVVELQGDRRIEVWRIRDKEGFCIRIFRPTEDGKVSKLKFGLSPEAALVLATMILNKHKPPKPRAA